MKTLKTAVKNTPEEELLGGKNLSWEDRLTHIKGQLSSNEELKSRPSSSKKTWMDGDASTGEMEHEWSKEFVKKS